MGIQVEFNPDLALRREGTSAAEKRSWMELIPEPLEPEKEYSFLKKGQRNYYLEGEIPLVETDGEGNLSRPLASIKIKEATHCIIDGEPWTRGTYEVLEVYSPDDPTIHFEGFARVKR